MSMRIDPTDNPFNATVGFEGEVRTIKFVLVFDGQMKLAEGDMVLSIIQPTRAGVEIVQDNSVDPRFHQQLKGIAEEKELTLQPMEGAHIFEFVTQPATHSNDLKKQFAEIAQMQSHLINYLIKQQKTNTSGLINVKEWIDAYNISYPKEKLIPSADADNMFIALDYSIKLLNLTRSQPAADVIQKQLSHGVQFNFVAALGKNMGHKLVEIFDENNRIPDFKNHIDLMQKSIKKTTEMLATLKFTNKNEINSYIAKPLQEIKQAEEFLKALEIERTILLQAQINANKSCEYIKKQYSSDNIFAQRKMNKLDGFFFILAMRMLTQTKYIPSSASSKNKYLFFLKTQLADLIDSLSENDKLQLKKINSTWSRAQKNELLSLIAGSSEALTIGYKIKGVDFTLKNVLESALGWGEKVSQLCNLFPGACIKTITPPFEPTALGLHRKTSDKPLRRILLEYRASQMMTLRQSFQEMEKTLARAILFCKTTYLHKQNGRNQSTLFQKKWESSEVKQEDNLGSKPVEKNVNAAMGLIWSSKTDDLKELLQELVFDNDIDITLKQINYLFLRIQDSKIIAEARKEAVQTILKEFYFEKIVEHFKYPLQQSSEAYLKYVRERYAIINKIPKLKEYIGVLVSFSKIKPVDHSEPESPRKRRS